MSEKFVHGGVEYTLPSPRGLTFESQAATYQLVCRSETPIYDTGMLVGKVRELVAEFGDTNAPQQYDESTGDAFVQMRGHFINTMEQAKQKDWTDEERAIVEKKLLAFQSPGLHWLHTVAPAQRPWPTYDETPAAKVAELAVTLGLVAEAQAYERENKSRKTVLAELDSAVAEPELIEAEEVAV